MKSTFNLSIILLLLVFNTTGSLASESCIKIANDYRMYLANNLGLVSEFSNDTDINNPFFLSTTTPFYPVTSTTNLMRQNMTTQLIHILQQAEIGDGAELYEFTDYVMGHPASEMNIIYVSDIVRAFECNRHIFYATKADLAIAVKRVIEIKK